MSARPWEEWSRKQLWDKLQAAERRTPEARAAALAQAVRQIAVDCDWPDEIAAEVVEELVVAVEKAGDSVRRELAEARRDLEESEEALEDLQRRQRNTVACLGRIRVAADEATGIGKETDLDAAGRAAGAEGAVALLVARYAGALAREAGEGQEGDRG